MLGGNRFEILHFYASPGVIRRGQTAQLCYGVSGAKTVRLEPQPNAVWPSFSRCVDVSPSKDTSYTVDRRRCRGTLEDRKVGGASSLDDRDAQASHTRIIPAAQPQSWANRSESPAGLPLDEVGAEGNRILSMSVRMSPRRLAPPIGFREIRQHDWRTIGKFSNNTQVAAHRLDRFS